MKNKRQKRWPVVSGRDRRHRATHGKTWASVMLQVSIQGNAVFLRLGASNNRENRRRITRDRANGWGARIVVDGGDTSHDFLGQGVTSTSTLPELSPIDSIQSFGAKYM